MIRPGIHLPVKGRRAVLYYGNEEVFCWARFQWWNPAHWTKKKRIW